MSNNRMDRIDRAKEIITNDPGMSKRRLQAQLKTEFGVGLSDTTRRELLQKSNTVGVLKNRVSSQAFTSYERLVLKKIMKRSGKAPYVAKIINERFQAMKKARDAGMTRAQFMRKVHQDAKAAGFLATSTTRTREKPDGRIKGRIDFWKMTRVYRQQDINAGDYEIPDRPKKKIDKGNVAAQKIRYQDRENTKAYSRWLEKQKNMFQKWIAQKEKAIAVAPNPVRKDQLEKELRNLEYTLENLR